MNNAKAKKDTKLDQVKKLIIEQAKEYGGQWFSNEKNRNIIVNSVDLLTNSSLNRYINLLKSEGFLSGNDMGRGWMTVNN